MSVFPHVDVAADLNAQDDDGHGWTTICNASEPASLHPGAIVVAGNPQAWAKVRILQVDADGQVHFEILT